MEIVIATSNLHKVRELKSMLKPLYFLDVRSLIDFPSYIPPEETGTTFEDNAKLKAAHAAFHLKKWVIADDSGLVVPALNGSPGVFSARFAGPNATDKDNRKKLLESLKGKLGLERAAFFECVLALSSPEGQTKVFKGIAEGLIIDEERGKNGFGYDPLFIKHDYNLTFAEIDEEIKNRISHRRKAIEKLKLHLESIAHLL
jgi:XTP/dITP diphosphohydrolase